MNKEMLDFCEGCNLRQSSGECMLGQRGQTIFFKQGYCEWSARKFPSGEIVRGVKTKEEFIPGALIFYDLNKT
jgi:hypothetical protein